MEQQHHNYEYNETFGFINAAFGETENFSLNQEEIPKTLPDFDSTTSITTNNDYNNPPVYDISSEPIRKCPDSQCLDTEIAKKENSSIEPSDQIEDHQDTENVQSHLEAVIENSQDESKENVEQSMECSVKATSEEIIEKTQSPENEKSNTDASNLDTKPAKKDTPYKKRRRIVVLNDDSDEEELKKELLGKSSDVEEERDTEKSQDAEIFADNEADESEHEKEPEFPVNKNFLKAKSLLQSAVIIQGPDKKKKKKKQRVLDSDDDDQMHTSVDDIGLINEENDIENEEEMLESDIVILNDNTFEAVENNADDLNSTTPTDQVAEQVESNENAEESKTVEDARPETPKSEKNEENKEESSMPEKQEEEADVDAILDKIQPMDDDDDFFKFNDSSEDDKEKSVPNDEYFGTPDKSAGTSTARKRGPKPGSRRKTENSRSAQRSRKRGSRYEEDFVDDSESSSSSYSESLSSSSESSTELVSRPKVKPVVKKPPIIKPPIVQKTIPVQRPIVAQKPTVPLNRPVVRKDRFFDKSRLIPNDVYFGDVKVPLHVLHSRWNSDGSEKTVRRPINTPIVNRNIPKVVSIPSTSKAPVQNIRVQQDEDTKLTVMKEFIKICGLKINYAKLFSNAKSTDHKCMMLRRILAQKGMEGEPTLAKCRKLKREMQAKRESAELDKSVILNTEGRTRRSRRRGVSSRDSDESLGTSNNEVESPKPSVPPQVLETLTKIKSVIDSDSE